MSVDAILLAGGGDAASGNKVFTDGAGHPIVWYVARALAAAPSVARVIAVGPAEDLRRAAGSYLAEVVPETGGTFVDNMLAGLSKVSGRRALAAAADIPLLVPDALEEFIQACAKEDADFYYPIVPQTILEDRYPGARKTFVRVLDGSFTGGNVYILNPGMVAEVRDLADKMVRARKKPWVMASIIGWSTALKLTSGRLSIKEVEEKLGGITGLTLRAVIMRRPELALDADIEHPENLEIIRRELQTTA